MAATLVATAYPQLAVETGAAFGDALISITGIGKPPVHVAVGDFGGRILRLCFDDIPIAAWTDRLGNDWQGPTPGQLSVALAFGRRAVAQSSRAVCRIAVHCAHGKSRSAAVALALMADHLGPGGEGEAVQRLLAYDHENRISCNPGLVRMADEMLGRGGAIEAALAAACPRFVIWRAYWMRQGCIDAPCP